MSPTVGTVVLRRPPHYRLFTFPVLKSLPELEEEELVISCPQWNWWKLQKIEMEDKIEVEIIRQDSLKEEDQVSADLQELKNRANRLFQQLGSLSLEEPSEGIETFLDSLGDSVKKEILEEIEKESRLSSFQNESDLKEDDEEKAEISSGARTKKRSKVHFSDESDAEREDNNHLVEEKFKEDYKSAFRRGNSNEIDVVDSFQGDSLSGGFPEHSFDSLNQNENGNILPTNDDVEIYASTNEEDKMKDVSEFESSFKMDSPPSFDQLTLHNESKTDIFEVSSEKTFEEESGKPAIENNAKETVPMLNNTIDIEKVDDNLESTTELSQLAERNEYTAPKFDDNLSLENEDISENDVFIDKNTPTTVDLQPISKTLKNRDNENSEESTKKEVLPINDIPKNGKAEDLTKSKEDDIEEQVQKEKFARQKLRQKAEFKPPTMRRQIRIKKGDESEDIDVETLVGLNEKDLDFLILQNVKPNTEESSQPSPTSINSSQDELAEKIGSSSTSKESLNPCWQDLDEELTKNLEKANRKRRADQSQHRLKWRSRLQWQMPFRDKLYVQLNTELESADSESGHESDDSMEDDLLRQRRHRSVTSWREITPTPAVKQLDPIIFAPTGDIYSYFQRRRDDYYAFSGSTIPLVYATFMALENGPKQTPSLQSLFEDDLQEEQQGEERGHNLAPSTPSGGVQRKFFETSV